MKTLILTLALTAVTPGVVVAQDAVQPPPMAPQQTQPQEAGMEPTVGTPVVSSDGAALGVVAADPGGSAQVLRVQTADGRVRTAAMAGAVVTNEGVIIAWTEAEFLAAPPPSDAMPGNPPVPPPPVETPDPTMPDPEPTQSPPPDGPQS
ncbi:hypothetical protein ACETK8_11930 [Brevundimonas staleyi]|uniref:Superoxide dismutase n=1 Tax=Brevundimonas staleyi TaxID=74326 RepID=A0ABW0FTJ7_9CAUL